MLRISLCTVFMMLNLFAGSAYADDTDFTTLAPSKTLAQSLADANKSNDPCKYVQEGDVAKAVGEKLATPPVRSVGIRPDENGTSCLYMLSGFRSVKVDVAKQGGAAIWRIVHGAETSIFVRGNVNANVDQTLGVAGDWDEIKQQPGGGLSAIQGDTLVSISPLGIVLDRAKVVDLMNAAYGRLDAPLEYDGAEAVAAAQKLDGTRPVQRGACSLIDAGSVAKITGQPLIGTPKETATQCDWRFGDAAHPKDFIYKFKWRDGYSEYANVHDISAAVSKGALAASPQAKQITGNLLDAKDVASPAWESGYQLGFMLTVVRKDMQLQVTTLDLTPDMASQLAAKIMSQF